ncbi:MAG: hypothetical protein OEM96_00750 [Gemmatimonadota bacterium]|nr:hypothetical protein [Gemmatimonadota bacterium]
MIEAGAGIAIMALLFAVFGFVRHNSGCDGDCVGCSGTCDHLESIDDNA